MLPDYIPFIALGFMAFLAIVTFVLLFGSHHQADSLHDSPPGRGTATHREPREEYAFRFKSRLFLYSYVMALVVRFSRLLTAIGHESQLAVMAIRGFRLTLFFGRGILHG